MTTTPTTRIYNSDGTFTDRPMDAIELAQYKIDQAEAQANNEAETQKAANKAALLERFGISKSEAALLLS